MKYYQRGAEVFAFESDGSQDEYIKPDMIAMTEEEINRHITRNKSGRAQKNEAGWMKQHRMNEATRVIYPLQDAVDLDMATEAERAQLVAWKTYRVLLNRVDISTAADIDWPEAPEREKMGN